MNPQDIPEQYPLPTWPWQFTKRWARNQLDRAITRGDRVAELLAQSSERNPRIIWRLVCLWHRHQLVTRARLDAHGKFAMSVHVGTGILENDAKTSWGEMHQYDKWLLGRKDPYRWVVRAVAAFIMSLPLVMVLGPLLFVEGPNYSLTVESYCTPPPSEVRKLERSNTKTDVARTPYRGRVVSTNGPRPLPNYCTPWRKP